MSYTLTISYNLCTFSFKEDLKRKNEIEGISTKKLKEDKDQREDNQEETSDTVNVEATQNLVSQVSHFDMVN